MLSIYLWSVLPVSAFLIWGDDETNKNSSTVREARLTQNPPWWSSLVDTLFVRSLDRETKRNLLEHYCDTLLWTVPAPDWNITDNSMFTLYRDEEAFRFDPRTSIFVYTLCVNIDEAWDGVTYDTNYTYSKRDYDKDIFNELTYTLWTSKSLQPVAVRDLVSIEKDDLNRAWWIPDQQRLDDEWTFHPCNPKTNMQGCKFSTLMPQLFRTIMNDYTNLKQASVMGYKRQEQSEWDALQSTDIPFAITSFARSHFWNLNDQKEPCDDPKRTYLSDSLVSGKSDHCYHPATYELVAKNIESVDRLVRKTDILNWPQVMKQFCDTKAPRNTIHGCAFSSFGDQPGISDRQSTYNVYLNEYLWYSMFINYYLWQITSTWTYSSLQQWNLYDNYLNQQRDWAALSSELAIAKDSLNQSIRLLKNLQTRYPVYIWMEAYKEDVIRYKEQLTNLYTPFNQLYDTFRNVQDPTQ